MLNRRRTIHANSIHAANSLTANVLTAQEFINQGTQGAAILSIALSIELRGNRRLAQHVRDIAFEVAAITGERFKYTAVGHVPHKHTSPANSNRPVRYGQRVAA